MTSQSEIPGARAGATGAEDIGNRYKSEPYRKRGAVATNLRAVDAECNREVAMLADGVKAQKDMTGGRQGVPQNEAHASAPALEPRSTFFTGADLDGWPVPERTWLVRDLIPSGTVTLVGGDGGTGKSLLALQLVVAVATSSEWLGRSVRCGNAVFFSAEDDRDELHRRLSDVIQANCLAWIDLGNLDLCSMAGEEALLATMPAPTGTPLAPSRLYLEIEAKLAERKPELLVLDTLADLFPGNENDRAQARRFIGMLRRLAIRHSCAVVLLSHPSLSGMTSGAGTSGSTGWSNSVRSRLYFERVVNEEYEADHNARILRTKKANYGPVGGEIAMKWSNGVFVADQVETGLEKQVSSAKAKRVFLSLLHLMAEQGRRVNTKGGLSYAPSIFEKHPQSEGIRKRQFAAAMEELLAKGVIKIGEDGPPSRRVSYLYEVAK